MCVDRVSSAVEDTEFVVEVALIADAAFVHEPPAGAPCPVERGFPAGVDGVKITRHCAVWAL